MKTNDEKDTGDESVESETPVDEEVKAADEARESSEEEAAADASEDDEGEATAEASEDDDDDAPAEASEDDEDEAAAADASEEDEELETDDEPSVPAVAAKPAAASSPDRTPMLAMAAVLFGVAVVAGLWWSGRGTEDESADVLPETAADSPESVGAAPEGAADPFSQGAGPQRPQPIPAPPDVAAPPENAQRSESGLAWVVLEEGTGSEHPSEDDIVTLDYTGWTTEGQMVDSTAMRGEPAVLPLNRAVDGWVEGVQLMVAGEKRRFWVPAELANTGRGAPPGTIVFDMQLVSFRTPPEPPPVPDNVSGAPADAERTESGLASKVLEAGSGEAHPAGNNRVRVHFTGWTSDGEMFDTSTALGEPATLPPLERIVPGMREGLELMVVGEKRRLWIPEDLAFSGRPGAPEGDLVFDIELVEILPPQPMGMPGMPGMPPGAGGPPRGMPPGAGGPPPGHPRMPPGAGGGRGRPGAGGPPPGHPRMPPGAGGAPQGRPMPPSGGAPPAR